MGKAELLTWAALFQLMDKCSDGSPAQLYGTYNIKENTTILVQIVKPRPDPNDKSEAILECNECGCQKCLLKSGDPLICDQCDNYWHLECANLTSIPTEKYWYCPNCINTDVEVVIGSGKSVDMSKTKLGERLGAKAKNWGGGVSCSGRQAECVIVPSTHVGPIPGIYCGQTWLYRISASEWGVHRSPVGGISGTTKNGAVSIVLSGGYEDDKDSGEEFIYTGSGGRDLEGNKRNGKHSGHQELTRFNLALAATCATKINDKVGGEAADWKKSRPVRVCRTSKLAKHNPRYAPEEGVRYDGLYKVVKYWPDKGASGFKVWRFLLRRDDSEPAPWTKEGKELAMKRGLRMIMQNQSETKQLVRYKIPKKVRMLMDADKANKRVWDEVRSLDFWSEYEFLHYLFSTAVVCSSGACHIPIKVNGKGKTI
ncbi:PUA-like domain-containing protein [Dichotomocladium elegans]|nr:PUA-like domain-containing protein [Dichotomocladium elegans]